MTSKQIERVEPFDISQNGWLREIAYQLALLNEKDHFSPEDFERDIVNKSKKRLKQ